MRTRPSSNLGEYSLSFGIAAIVCTLVPVIGDLIAAPLALLAVVLGVMGVSRREPGHLLALLAAGLGTVLGTVSLFVVALMLIVAGTGP